MLSPETQASTISDQCPVGKDANELSSTQDQNSSIQLLSLASNGTLRRAPQKPLPLGPCEMRAWPLHPPKTEHYRRQGLWSSMTALINSRFLEKHSVVARHDHRRWFLPHISFESLLVRERRGPTSRQAERTFRGHHRSARGWTCWLEAPSHVSQAIVPLIKDMPWIMERASGD